MEKGRRERWGKAGDGGRERGWKEVGLGSNFTAAIYYYVAIRPSASSPVKWAMTWED